MKNTLLFVLIGILSFFAIIIIVGYIKQYNESKEERNIAIEINKERMASRSSEPLIQID